MRRFDLFKKITQQNERKIVLIVLDGLGGLPLEGKTELEQAATPNLDLLSQESELGLTHPIMMGVTPGSGPAHLSLFGYDPLEYEIGRGVLEAVGLDIELSETDLAVRGNFATIKDGVIVDRRAGRISTAENQKIVAELSSKIKKIEDVEIKLFSGEEHRFVLILSGPELSDQLSDADPEKENAPLTYTRPKSPEAEKTARIINKFIDQLISCRQKQLPANCCLLRGYAKPPKIPSMSEVFGLKPAAIAVYPMYRGLARLVGMEILPAGKTISDQINFLKKHYSEFDFFFIHIKKTDSYGEDGNFAGKIKIIEEFDHLLPEIMELTPDVLAITGDHSTPSLMKSHSWHPNPFLLKSKTITGSPAFWQRIMAVKSITSSLLCKNSS